MKQPPNKKKEKDKTFVETPNLYELLPLLLLSAGGCPVRLTLDLFPIPDGDGFNISYRLIALEELVAVEPPKKKKIKKQEAVEFEG